MNPKPVDITTEQFERLVEIQIRERMDWPATFSTNEKEEIWPFCTFGRTANSNRHYVQEESEILRTIAAIYREQRDDKRSGRFHIDYDGVYGHFGTSGKDKKLVVIWKKPIDSSEIKVKPVLCFQKIKQLTNEGIRERNDKAESFAKEVLALKERWSKGKS